MNTDHRDFENQFAELTCRWNAHQDLRRSHASVADLAASRRDLDAARARVRGLNVA